MDRGEIRVWLRVSPQTEPGSETGPVLVPGEGWRQQQQHQFTLLPDQPGPQHPAAPQSWAWTWHPTLSPENGTFFNLSKLKEREKKKKSPNPKQFFKENQRLEIL